MSNCKQTTYEAHDLARVMKKLTFAIYRMKTHADTAGGLVLDLGRLAEAIC